MPPPAGWTARSGRVSGAPIAIGPHQPEHGRRRAIESATRACATPWSWTPAANAGR